MSGPVHSVSQAFAILRHLAQAGGPQTLTDVCRALDLSPSSGLNLLRTLLAEQAITRDADGKRYTLSPGWQGLAVLRDDAAMVIAAVRPLLSRLAEEQDAAVGLWQVQPGDRLALVALGESGAATRIHMVEGQRQPLGSGASGRAIAAYENPGEKELRRRFAKVRWRRPLTYPAWAQQIGRAARDGYAIDDGFGHPGICSISAVVPPHAPGDPVRFCVSASVFAASRDARQIAALGEGLLRLAADPAFAL